MLIEINIVKLAMELELKVVNRRPVLSVTVKVKPWRWFKWDLCKCKCNSPAGSAKEKV